MKLSSQKSNQRCQHETKLRCLLTIEARLALLGSVRPPSCMNEGLLGTDQPVSSVADNEQF